MLSPFIKDFLTKNRFSVHRTHSCVNFAWFAFLNHQKLDDRTLFITGALYVICGLSEYPLNKKINHVTFVEKKILKKNCLKIALFIVSSFYVCIYCWRSRDELISDILLWAPSHGRSKAGGPAGTLIQQLCADTGCSLEDLPGAMDDRDGWRERAREIRADGTTW